jgi:hypothetical protein
MSRRSVFSLAFQVPDRETRLNEKNRDWECVVGKDEVMNKFGMVSSPGMTQLTKRCTPPGRVNGSFVPEREAA